MTLVGVSPSPTIEPKVKFDNDSISDDNQSQSSQDDIRTIQNYYPKDFVVQNLGHPNGDVLPNFGNVSIDNSSDVHFGDKNIYQGPVTIKQIVYANGTALVTGSDINSSPGARHNPAYEDDSDSDNRKDGFSGDVKVSDNEKGCDKKDVEAAGATDGVVDTDAHLPAFRKGFIWLQNIPKQRPLEIVIFLTIVILSLVVLMVVLFLKHAPAQGKSTAVVDSDEQDKIQPVEYDPDITAISQIINKLRIISRQQWVAQPPVNASTPLHTPVPYVIIQHTATDNCSSQAQCVFHVRYIQTFHIESRGFFDIGYNFLVGGDGAAYEGRGWTSEGAHTYGYNSKSIGIAFIGTFLNTKPPEIQIIACQKLIEKGVELGYIAKDYKLLAARQLQGTESPGLALYEDMKKWPHWAKAP